MIRHNDYMLLDLWRDGDQNAGEELFERHYDMLYRLFANEMETDAARVVIEAFAACREGRGPIDPHKSFRAHLLASAYRVHGAGISLRANDRFRRSIESSVEMALQMSPAAADTPDELADTILDSNPAAAPHTPGDQRDEQRRRKFLQTLPVEARIIVELHDIERLSEHDIANILGTPIIGVTRWLQAIRGQFEWLMERNALEDTVDDEPATRFLREARRLPHPRHPACRPGTRDRGIRRHARERRGSALGLPRQRLCCGRAPPLDP
jgi:DNA-directed RNA polymerase specialized sigma24 family protein